MESVSSKRDDTVRRQADILQQIEALKAQLAQIPDAPTTPPPTKNHISAPTLLAPSTPSPKKKRARLENERSPSRGRASRQNALPRPPLITKQSSRNLPDKSAKVTTLSATGLNMKAQLHTLNEPDQTEETVSRSEGFSQKPAPLTTGSVKSLNRDDRLAVVEDLKLGPPDHKPSLEDPNFEKLEPNSGIRLSSRLLSHSALQDYLFGRYFLPPTLLYSVVRLLPNKQAYEVPVDADWVTIAVIAERGDIKLTNGPANYVKSKEDEGLENSDEKKAEENKPPTGGKRKRDDDGENAEENPRRGKKYVHMKLVDLGTMSRTSSSSASHRGSLRGDAQLNLLLFESDHYDKIIEKVEDANGKKKEKVTKLWKGGSGGAFEECYVKLREGAVIALLNPKVLKPFNNTRQPGSASILALTPPSASAVAILGYAQDLGKCTVRKRDGAMCGSWVDRRHSHVAGKAKGEDVCEYHIQSAVQHARASRPEFSIGTSGMSATSRRGSSFNSNSKGGSNTFDPERKWGLKPEGPTRGADGETTYVLGGHVAGSSAIAAPGSTAEKMGRESQARANRKRERDTDVAMRRLLEESSCSGRGSSENQAMEVVRRARAVSIKGAKKSTSKETERHPEGPTENAPLEKRKYPVNVVRGLGFDPSLIGVGREQTKKRTGSDKLSKLLQCMDPKSKEHRLGPPPGKKVRSGVVAPATSRPEKEDDSVMNNSLGADIDSDSDLEIEPPPPALQNDESDDVLYVE